LTTEAVFEFDGEVGSETGAVGAFGGVAGVGVGCVCEFCVCAVVGVAVDVCEDVLGEMARRQTKAQPKTQMMRNLRRWFVACRFMRLFLIKAVASMSEGSLSKD
jgi:hypothetical protein